MNNAITCPACGVEERFRDGDAPVPIHEVGDFRCDGCGARYVFGKLVMKIVVEPYFENGVRWTRLRAQHPVTRADVFIVDVEPGPASASLAKNILSISVP